MTVNHVVVLDYVFTGVKVVTLNALLRCFKRFTNSLVVDWPVVIYPEPLHKGSHALTLEDTHKIVFGTHVKLRHTRVTLTTTTTTQLVVNTAGFVPLRADH